MTRTINGPTWRPSDLPYPTPGERPTPLRTPLAEWSDLDGTANKLRLLTGRAYAKAIGGGSPSADEANAIQGLLRDALAHFAAAVGAPK